MSVVVLQDGIVHYEVLGRGRPLMFLHGWVGSWRYWVPSMQSLSASYRSYAIDLWGYGDTAKVPERYSLEFQSRLIASFLEHLGVLKIALVGHGLGALVGLQFAAQHPDSVDRLIAIGIPEMNAALNPRLGSTSPMDLAEWILGHSTDSQVVRQETSKIDQRAIQAVLAGAQGNDIASFTKDMHRPCLFVHGGNDPLLANTSDPEENFFLPENFHQIFFEGSGHFPMLDDPGKFNRLMADFLSLASGESPRRLQLKEEWRRRVR
jgi:3-oxoadipate enol-lactonase